MARGVSTNPALAKIIVSEVAFKMTLGLTHISANHALVKGKVQVFVSSLSAAVPEGYSGFLAKKNQQKSVRTVYLVKELGYSSELAYNVWRLSPCDILINVLIDLDAPPLLWKNVITPCTHIISKLLYCCFIACSYHFY